MTKWILKFTQSGEDDLCALDSSVRKRVVEKLRWLEENFLRIELELLGGKWKGYYKLRVGDWRVIYTLVHQGSIIKILRIELRDKVYK